jgi:hypothetical protein
MSESPRSITNPALRYRHVGDPLAIPASAPQSQIREAILEAVRQARLDRSAVGAKLDEIELLARAIRGAR